MNRYPNKKHRREKHVKQYCFIISVLHCFMFNIVSYMCSVYVFVSNTFVQLIIPTCIGMYMST